MDYFNALEMDEKCCRGKVFGDGDVEEHEMLWLC